MNIIIADDHPAIRTGLRLGLTKYHEISVIGEAGNGVILMDILRSGTMADVLLLDMEMPKMDGLAVLHEINKEQIDIKILVLSMHDDDEAIAQVLEAGAHGYLCKIEEDEVIYRAIMEIYQTGFHFNKYTNSVMFDKLVRKKKPPVPVTSLPITFSAKELQIIAYISKEMTNNEIASLINLSPRTVEGIRRELIQKVGAQNSIGLVLYALKTGLVQMAA